MRLAQVTRYDIVRGAYGNCKTLHFDIWPALQTTVSPTTRAVSFDANRSNNPDNGYALTVKEVMFCSNMMREMGYTLRLRSYLHKQRFNCTCHRHRHLVKLINTFKI